MNMCLAAKRTQGSDGHLATPCYRFPILPLGGRSTINCSGLFARSVAMTTHSLVKKF